MRFAAVHDAAGNIAALISIPPDSPLAGMRLEPGQRITEVEVPEIPYDLDEASVTNRAIEMIGTFRVETEYVQGTLVKKEDAETT